ncbi:MAG TPA: glutathione S-transferase family protein [Kofleriaceae bacterium]|nr:glutathione S-transferase family protein [Kofleriaceae bacterium]
MSFGGRDRLYGMQLYYHPRSPYSHKVMIALAEKRVAYEPIMIRPDDAQFAKLTPIKKVPLLVLADGWKIPESTIIIEYLDTHFSTGTRLIPDDRDLARQTRFYDRIADLYVTEPLMTLLFKRGDADAAHTRLDAMLAGLDEHISKRPWIMGDELTMADCSFIPALRYARELHPFDRHKHVVAYMSRALERPSVRSVFEQVAPHLEKSA